MNIYENINEEINTLYSKLQKQQNSSNRENYEENKIKISQEYGLSKIEVDQLLEQIQHGFYLFQSSSQDYNNGDIYYDNSEIDDERKELEKAIKKSIEKYIIRQKISEIKPDEITPDLIEELQKSGYDGKSGHPVLQSYFQMYTYLQEQEKRRDSDKSKISYLETEVAKNAKMVRALTERDTQMTNYITAQSKSISSISKQMPFSKEKISSLIPKLKPKSFGEMVKRFFLKTRKTERMDIQRTCAEIKMLNEYAIDDCTKASKYTSPMSLESILREQQTKGIVHNNIFDKIASPIQENQDLVDLINMYATLKDHNQLSQMYSYIVNKQKRILPEEMAQYDDKFFSFIVKPAVIDLSKRVKNGEYHRFDESFAHLYTIEQMEQMFKEKSAEEILEKGKNIEGKNQGIFDKLNSIFWKHGNEDRRQLYINYLKENNINLSETELLDWMDYRAVMEEFQNPKLMGFHLRKTFKKR